MNRLVLLFVALALSACGTAPILSDPSEKVGEDPRGVVSPLSSLLPTPPGKLKLILIHGVGDFCPGYALAPENSWLNEKTIVQVGLVAEGEPTKPVKIFDDEFFPKRHDDKSSVAVVQRKFKYRKSSAEYVDVDAIEITWSGLTQWIKSNQLGYDLSAPIKDPKDATSNCIEDVAGDKRLGRPRALLNRVLKEQILDRRLADAVIYVGLNRRKMQRGLAEALCRSLSSPIENGPCRWPKPSENERTRYIFVTHSLGSRMLYDTVLALRGHDTTTEGEPAFSEDEKVGAQAFTDHLLTHTPVIYMMANQVPLLGLAFFDPTLTSSEGPNPSFADRDRSDGGPKPSSQQNAVSRTGECVICKFAKERKKVVQSSVSVANANAKAGKMLLEIVAFSDPNDLLSWSIPEWYVGESQVEGLDVRFTNVYVENAFPWFKLLALPDQAHTGYVKNGEVWKVIRCGGEKGRVRC